MRTVRIISIALFFALILSLFTGCSKKDENPEGSWKMESATMNGKTVSAEEVGGANLELKHNGDFIMSDPSGAGDDVKGWWSYALDKGEGIASAGDMEFKIKIVKGKLVFNTEEEGGRSMTFIRN